MRIRIQAEKRAEALANLSRMSPSRRLAELSLAETIQLIGARAAHQMRKLLGRRAKSAESGLCSAAWIEAYLYGDKLPPGLRWGDRGRIVAGDTASLVLSRAAVRFGDGIPSRRWTPAQCVELEDMLDEMSCRAADHYHFPASPSAHAIQLHGLYVRRAMERMADDRGGVGRGRATAGAKKRRRQY